MLKLIGGLFFMVIAGVIVWYLIAAIDQFPFNEGHRYDDRD